MQGNKIVQCVGGNYIPSLHRVKGDKKVLILEKKELFGGKKLLNRSGGLQGNC